MVMMMMMMIMIIIITTIMVNPKAYPLNLMRTIVNLNSVIYCSRLERV